MKKTILSFTAMCCMTMHPEGSLNQQGDITFKRVSVRKAQEGAWLETALASMVREEDIQQLAGSFHQKLLESAQGQSWELSRLPLLLLTHDFWQFILTGVDQHQAFGLVKLSLPPDNPGYWLGLFSTTIEEHFSGTMGMVAQQKVEQYLDAFLYRLLLLHQ